MKLRDVTFGFALTRGIEFRSRLTGYLNESGIIWPKLNIMSVRRTRCAAER